MSNRHQELASPEQTASALAIPGQTTTGKESSNPLMADSLPKTIQSNDPPLSRGYTLGSGEDSLELMELMAYCTNLCEFVSKKNREIKKVKVLVYEASIRRHLKLEDSEGLSSLPNAEIFEQLANMGVKKLEKHVQTTNSKRKTKIVLSEDEDAIEDPSNQGRIIEEIDLDTYITLVTLTKVSSQRRGVGLTQTYTRRRINVGTGSGGVSTASRILSIAGKPEPPKKLKKRVQAQMNMDEEIAKKMFEEEQAKVMTEQEQERINLEAALELQRKLDAREEVLAEATQATQEHEID
ncbi:hypothetical protein Tco_1136311 [Tanacetum coccineum]